MRSVPEVLASAVSTQPLVTFYDDATGERTELSGITVGNWVAKTGNLLTDGYGLGAGDTALVALPVHWQSAVILLGCWSAGLRVLTPAGVGTPPDTAGPDAAGSTAADIAFAAEPGALDSARVGDRLLVSLHPFGLPARELPDGWSDYLADVRGYGDRYPPRGGADDPATAELTQAELVDAAVVRAAELGIPRGARLLIDVDTHPDPLEWLLAPLVAGASTVLCRNLDKSRADARSTSEQATLVLP